jgi:cobalt-zinc-cadmium efflux system outer membrane protein
MKRLNVILILTTGLSAIAAEESGTNVFKQEDFVAEVLRRNPEVQFYEAEIAATKGERKAAGTLANPELNGNVGHKRAHDTAGTLAGEGVAWSVGLAQTFDWPGRLGLRKAIANRPDLDGGIGPGEIQGESRGTRTNGGLCELRRA